MNAPRSTLFDFNGVLVDDEAVHLEAFRETVAPLGITLEDGVYEARYLGFDDVGAFRAMLTDAKLPATDADVAKLVEAKKPIYMRRIASGLVVFEGAREIVLRRAALGPIGIVSGALRHEIEHVLGIMGVRDAFACIVAAEDVAHGKPDPEGYARGVAALGVARDTVVVIEDSLAGIVSAKAAGVRCAGVAHTYSTAELASAGADVVAARIALLTDAMLDG